MWGTTRTRSYALHNRGFHFSVHSLAFDLDISYGFTLSELHLAGGQFLYLWSLCLTSLGDTMLQPHRPRRPDPLILQKSSVDTLNWVEQLETDLAADVSSSERPGGVLGESPNDHS
ncbi:uncharacterized protein DS421_14g460130 [Arachis hypogaea]|nr:uncharacterized protein DS421_14g460130 [Arachis hypogaea]